MFVANFSLRFSHFFCSFRFVLIFICGILRGLFTQVVLLSVDLSRLLSVFLTLLILARSLESLDSFFGRFLLNLLGSILWNYSQPQRPKNKRNLKTKIKDTQFILPNSSPICQELSVCGGNGQGLFCQAQQFWVLRKLVVKQDGQHNPDR